MRIFKLVKEVRTAARLFFAGGALAIGVRAMNLTDSPGLRRRLFQATNALRQEIAAITGGSTSCEDCGRFGGNYMLREDVWRQATDLDHANILCMPCVEQRICRRLVPSDLDDELPINETLFDAMEMVESRAENVVDLLCSMSDPARRLS